MFTVLFALGLCCGCSFDVGLCMFATLCCFVYFGIFCFALYVLVFDCNLLLLGCEFGLGWLGCFDVLVVGWLLVALLFAFVLSVCLLICV